jgi:hypothetical protein
MGMVVGSPLTLDYPSLGGALLSMWRMDRQFFESGPRHLPLLGVAYGHHVV